jgi:hypothetical protein
LKCFPQQNAHAKGFFVNYIIWSALSGANYRTLWPSICWWSKQQSYCRTLGRLKSVPRSSGKCNQTQNHIKQLLNDTMSGRVLVSWTTNHP